MTKNIPFVKKIMDLGCTDEKKINAALQTYIELNEGEAKSGVDFFYNKTFNVIFFIVSHRDGDRNEAYVPVNSKEMLSVSFLKSLREAINAELGGNESIVLVIRDGDSNTSKYRCTPGLKPPDSPESVKKFKREEEKELYKRSEIRKNKKALYEKAILDKKMKEPIIDEKEDEGEKILVDENQKEDMKRLSRKRKFVMRKKDEGGKMFVDENIDERRKALADGKKDEGEKSIVAENKIEVKEKDEVDENIEEMIESVEQIVHRMKVNDEGDEEEKVEKFIDKSQVKDGQNIEEKERINEKAEIVKEKINRKSK